MGKQACSDLSHKDTHGGSDHLLKALPPQTALLGFNFIIQIRKDIAWRPPQLTDNFVSAPAFKLVFDELCYINLFVTPAKQLRSPLHLPWKLQSCLTVCASTLLSGCTCTRCSDICSSPFLASSCFPSLSSLVPLCMPNFLLPGPTFAFSIRLCEFLASTNPQSAYFWMQGK